MTRLDAVPNAVAKAVGHSLRDEDDPKPTQDKPSDTMRPCRIGRTI